MKLSFKRLGLAGGALIAAACATLAVPATAVPKSMWYFRPRPIASPWETAPSSR